MPAGPPAPDRRSQWRPQWPVKAAHSRFGPFTDRQLDPDRFAGAHNRQVDDRADAVGPERPYQRTHAGELLVVPSDDNVALPDTGSSRGTGLIDTHHHRAHAIVELDGLQSDPEIAPRDPAMGFKPPRDTVDRRAGNDENASHALDGHAYSFAGRIEG